MWEKWACACIDPATFCGCACWPALPSTACIASLQWSSVAVQLCAVQSCAARQWSNSVTELVLRGGLRFNNFVSISLRLLSDLVVGNLVCVLHRLQEEEDVPSSDDIAVSPADVAVSTESGVPPSVCQLWSALLSWCSQRGPEPLTPRHGRKERGRTSHTNNYGPSASVSHLSLKTTAVVQPDYNNIYIYWTIIHYYIIHYLWNNFKILSIRRAILINIKFNCK